MSPPADPPADPPVDPPVDPPAAVDPNIAAAAEALATRGSNVKIAELRGREDFDLWQQKRGVGLLEEVAWERFSLIVKTKEFLLESVNSSGS